MKVIIEDVSEKEYSRYRKERKNKVEVNMSPLWEDPDKVFKPEEMIPPEKWDFQIHKVKY